MDGLLNGLNVLDFGRGAVGPWAASLLGSMGANVVKVESPEGEAMLRQLPRQNGYAVAYIAWNANKKGIALDLKLPQERLRMQKLVLDADVIMGNLRPGALDGLGLSFQDAIAINPEVVYASCPGWGFSGPMRDMIGGDPDFQAFSGFASLNGEEGSQGEVFRHAYPLDLHAGVLFASTVLLGLLQRDKTGKAQRVNASHLGSSLFLLVSRAAEYLALGNTPKPMGCASASSAPHEAFLCQDTRHLALGVENESQWRGLCEALGQEELFQDPRWSTNSNRVDNRGELSQELSAIFATKPARWWAIQLEKYGVPFGYFYDFETLRHHEQVKVNNFMFVLESPYQGKLYVGGAPWKFHNSQTRILAAPRHGEDTEMLLGRGFEAFGTEGHFKLAWATALMSHEPPLAGVRVVDASQGLAGPYLTLLLAEAGAEVVKVEPPTGDYARRFVPLSQTGDSVVFHALNRNKKSVTIDLGTKSGAESLHRLVSRADIFIEDWGPDQADKIGMGYNSLVSDLPGLIYCAISPFGELGPFRGRPGSELVAQAYSETHLSLGELGAKPLRIGADLANFATGAVGFLGVLAALLKRNRTGRGERIAVSLLGTMICFRQACWTSLGSPDSWSGPYAEPYDGKRVTGRETADKRMFLRASPTNPDAHGLAMKVWEKMRGEFPGHTTGEAGAAKYSYLELPLPHSLFESLPSTVVKDMVISLGGQAIEMNRINEAVEHPQCQALGIVQEYQDPHLGRIRFLRAPWKGSWKEPSISLAPELGQHNDVLNG